MSEKPHVNISCAGEHANTSRGRTGHCWSLEGDYTLDLSKDPKQFVLSGAIGGVGGMTGAIYSLEGNRLVICFNLRPGGATPTEFETSDQDGRMLVTLERLEVKR